MADSFVEPHTHNRLLRLRRLDNVTVVQATRAVCGPDPGCLPAQGTVFRGRTSATLRYVESRVAGGGRRR